MMHPRLYFPHIPRIFSALCLWLLLFALIGFNVSVGIAKPLASSDKLIDVLHHPLSWNAHVALARSLWENGTKNRGIQELLLADELFPKNVLGAETNPDEILRNWQNEPVRRQQQEDYWKNVLVRHADYRDAYIQLAALAYGDGNLSQTRAYLVQAQDLDPNNVAVIRLVNFTSKFLE